jgi:hypothetical protein
MPFCLEMFEGNARGLLLGLFFCRALRFRQGAGTAGSIGNADLDAEELLVIGPALRGKNILGLAGSSGLQVLLESGFVVADGPTEGVSGAQRALQIGKGWFDDVALDEDTRDFQASIEIESCDYGFESVGEQCRLLASAALLLAPTKTKQGAKGNALGDGSKMTAADERGAEPRELALAGVGKTAVEALRHGEA